MTIKQSTASGSKVRRLKVYQKINVRETKFWYQNYTTRCPEIRLMGKWLAACGFQPGQHIEIIQERNKLTITPVWVEDGD